MALTISSPTAVAYLRREGEGLAAPRVLLPREAGLPTSLTGGDLDLDGDLDLLLGTDKNVLVFDQQPGLTFGTERSRPIAGGLTGVELVDMDADGDLDVVVGKTNKNRLVVLNNDGSGEFAQLSSADVWVAPRAVSVGDLDGDGDVDVALSGVAHNGVAILWKRDERLPVLVDFAKRELPLSGEPHGATVADLDGDGIPDVATSNGSSGRVTVRKSDGGEALSSWEGYSVPNGGHLLSITATDVDGDRDLDLAIGDSRENVVKLLLNDGTGSFSDNSPGLAAGRGPRAVAAGDLTGDGAVDLLCANRDGNTVSLFLGDGNGGFAEARQLPVGSGPVGLGVSDLDADGNLDVVVPNLNSRDVTLLWGDGRGEFSPDGLLFLRGQPSYVVVSDLDADGVPDVATSNGGTQDVTVFLGTGRREFQDGLDYVTGESSYSLITADINADGEVDLVTANDRTDTVSLHLGSGDGTFGLPHCLDVGRERRFVLAGDFNQDGRADLVTTNKSANNLSLLLGATGGVLQPLELLERICTDSDFRSISARPREGDPHTVHYIVPVTPDAVLKQPLFINAELFGLPDGLVEALPDVFLDVTIERLVLRRDAREYVIGSLLRFGGTGFRTRRGHSYAFTVEVAADPEETFDAVEVAQVYQALSGAFVLRPLAYRPSTETGRARFRNLREPPFPLLRSDSTAPFRRGDVDMDGRATVRGVVLVLGYLFDRDSEIDCQKSADFNDDSCLNLLDPLALVALLFSRGESPPAPFHACGGDPMPDALGCERFAGCP